METDCFDENLVQREIKYQMHLYHLSLIQEKKKKKKDQKMGSFLHALKSFTEIFHMPAGKSGSQEKKTSDYTIIKNWSGIFCAKP